MPMAGARRSGLRGDDLKFQARPKLFARPLKLIDRRGVVDVEESIDLGAVHIEPTGQLRARDPGRQECIVQTDLRGHHGRHVDALAFAAAGQGHRATFLDQEVQRRQERVQGLGPRLLFSVSAGVNPRQIGKRHLDRAVRVSAEGDGLVVLHRHRHRRGR